MRLGGDRLGAVEKPEYPAPVAGEFEHSAHPIRRSLLVSVVVPHDHHCRCYEPEEFVDATYVDRLEPGPTVGVCPSEQPGEKVSQLVTPDCTLVLLRTEKDAVNVKQGDRPFDTPQPKLSLEPAQGVLDDLLTRASLHAHDVATTPTRPGKNGQATRPLDCASAREYTPTAEVPGGRRRRLQLQVGLSRRTRRLSHRTYDPAMVDGRQRAMSGAWIIVAFVVVFVLLTIWLGTQKLG
jgi:hypothetical protein